MKHQLMPILFAYCPILILLSCTAIPPEGILIEGAEGVWPVGDTNGDGNTDLAIAQINEITEYNGTYGSLTINLVTGTIPTRSSWALSQTLHTLEHSQIKMAQQFSLNWSLAAVANFNNDATSDLMVTTWSEGNGAPAAKSTELSVVLGSDTGDPITVQMVNSPLFNLHATGDVNGDGLDDLLGTANIYGDPAALLMGTVNAVAEGLSGAELQLLEGYYPTIRPIGDIDGNGLVELAAQDGCALTIFSGETGGLSSNDLKSMAIASINISEEGCDDQRIPVALGDINGDGLDDFALAPDGVRGSAETWRFDDNQVPIVFGHSQGVDGLDLDQNGALLETEGPVTIVVGGGTLDEDAKDDLIILIDGGDSLGLVRVSGDEIEPGTALSVTAEVLPEPQHIPSATFIGDVDNDGIDDIGIHYPSEGVRLFSGKRDEHAAD